jgi:spermidine/putrescine ABC transporter ATP-binding subunit
MSGEQRIVVAADAVTKRFGGVTAVDNLSLAIAEKEFFALLGPSGCGKTTLLRVIAGFERPDTGRVLLDGRDITDLRPNRRPVNMMFQSYALFPHLTVQGNVSYGLEMEGVAAPERARRVAEALDLVQLGSAANRRPHQLSGGQRQRVALARALVKRPRVLLLDEPLAALDRKLRQQMQFELKRLQHDIGITFLVVTHDQEEALAMADRIALMDSGRIAQLDTPRGLYERPANRFVAGFIGMTNFLDGRLVSGGIEVEGIGLIRGEAPKGTGGNAATLAVRPERIQVLSAPGAAGALSGTVVGIAYLGQDLVVQIGLPGREQPLVARLSAGSEAARHLASGTKVWCDWPPEAAHILID